LQTEDEARKITYRSAVVPCRLLHKRTARICILVKCPGDYYLHLYRIAADGYDMFTVSDRLQGMVGKVQMKLTDTELKLDIRKLESLGLSSQEERVPWIFFATFSNQLQQLAKHVLHEDYIFFYESANVDVAHTIEEVPFTKKQNLNVI
ncbi:unnamed protein product, partial [Rotaria sp. Silwood1]